MAVVEQRAVGRLGIAFGQHRGNRSGQAEPFQRSAIVGFGQILIGDWLARKIAQRRRQIGKGKGIITGQFVGRGLGRFGGQHFHCSRRVIGARSPRNAARAGAAQHRPMRDRHRRALRIIFGVPAIAEQRVRHAAVGQGQLGRTMFDREVERVGVGMEQAGIGDEADPGGLGGGDDGLMLCYALPDLARRDQQQPIDTGRARWQGFRRDYSQTPGRPLPVQLNRPVSRGHAPARRWCQAQPSPAAQR
ncbi:unnamed protein product [Rhizophagus irregularis]|uniref:Uncharacterized protein n=1 Tax=Rhizophagus irregularis TaxID=588596 RepID=A0A915ZCB7_9GLOM|nr:unnamed protein product [Rhizophagus irregularis]